MGEIFCLPSIFYPTPNSIVFGNKLTLSLKFNQDYYVHHGLGRAQAH